MSCEFRRQINRVFGTHRARGGSKAVQDPQPGGLGSFQTCEGQPEFAEVTTGSGNVRDDLSQRHFAVSYVAIYMSNGETLFSGYEFLLFEAAQ